MAIFNDSVIESASAADSVVWSLFFRVVAEDSSPLTTENGQYLVTEFAYVTDYLPYYGSQSTFLAASPWSVRYQGPTEEAFTAAFSDTVSEAGTASDSESGLRGLDVIEATSASDTVTSRVTYASILTVLEAAAAADYTPWDDLIPALVTELFTGEQFQTAPSAWSASSLIASLPSVSSTPFGASQTWIGQYRSMQALAFSSVYSATDIESVSASDQDSSTSKLSVIETVVSTDSLDGPTAYANTLPVVEAATAADYLGWDSSVLTAYMPEMFDSVKFASAAPWSTSLESYQPVLFSGQSFAPGVAGTSNAYWAPDEIFFRSDTLLSITEGATAIDTTDGSLSSGVATVGESASASDMITVVFAVSIVETVTANDSTDAANNAVAAVSDPLTATDSLEAFNGNFGSVSEATSTLDASSAIATVVADVVETSDTADSVDGPCNYSADVNESVSLSEFVDFTGDSLVFIEEIASAADETSLGAGFVGSLSETTSVSDEITATAESFVSVIDATGATENLDGPTDFQSDVSEIDSSSDSINASGNVLAAADESAFATTTCEALVEYITDITEAGSASDQNDASELEIATIVESITASDVANLKATYPVAIGETASSVDDTSAAKLSTSVVNETVAAADIIAGTSDYISGIAVDELASTIDQFSAFAEDTCAVAENASASEILDGVLQVQASVIDIASTDDNLTVTYLAAGLCIELSEATDDVEPTVDYAELAVIEDVVASDSCVAGAVLETPLEESAAPSETVDAAWVVGADISESAGNSDNLDAVDFSVFVESGLATDSPDAVINFVAGFDIRETGEAEVTLGVTITSDVIEPATIDDTSSTVLVVARTLAENGSADEFTAVVLSANPEFSETASLDDLITARFDFVEDVVGAATATDDMEATAVMGVSVAEALTAEDDDIGGFLVLLGEKARARDSLANTVDYAANVSEANHIADLLDALLNRVQHFGETALARLMSVHDVLTYRDPVAGKRLVPPGLRELPPVNEPALDVSLVSIHDVLTGRSPDAGRTDPSRYTPHRPMTRSVLPKIRHGKLVSIHDVLTGREQLSDPTGGNEKAREIGGPITSSVTNREAMSATEVIAATVVAGGSITEAGDSTDFLPQPPECQPAVHFTA